MIIEHYIIAVILLLLIKAYKDLIKSNMESFEHADRANRYYWAVKDLDTWCRYDLPETEIIAKYLLATGEGLPMNAGTPAGKEACTIVGLREQIRRMKLVK